MNGSSRPPKRQSFNPEEPGGPVDMRDVRALRDDLERVEQKVDGLAGGLARSLAIQAATYEALTGKDVEDIPGVALLAAREHRFRRDMRRGVAAAAVAFALIAAAFGAGHLGARSALAKEVAHHAP